MSYGTERGRFLVPASLVAWVIALGLALPWLFADLGALATSGGPAIAVLLSTSALFSGLVLRSGEHPLVRLVLAPYRLVPGGGDDGRGRGGRFAGLPRLERDVAVIWGLGALCGRPFSRYPDRRGRTRSSGGQGPLDGITAPTLPSRTGIPEGHPGAFGGAPLGRAGLAGLPAAVSGEEARAALERSRARRAAANGSA